MTKWTNLAVFGCGRDRLDSDVQSIPDASFFSFFEKYSVQGFEVVGPLILSTCVYIVLQRIRFIPREYQVRTSSTRGISMVSERAYCAYALSIPGALSS